MKLAVYSISKNVVSAVPAFMDRLDALKLPLFVLDHSDDGTDKLLRKRGAIVDTTPMKRDFALMKNHAMRLANKYHPFDFLLNVDLDEQVDVRAMQRLIPRLDRQTTKVRHLYKPDGNADRVREETRVHSATGYRWEWPIHECLVYDGVEVVQDIAEVILTQWPDPERKHTWSELLLRAVKDYPDSTRMRMLCARDLYFDGRYKESLEQGGAFLNLQSMGFDASYVLALMSRCHRKLGDDKMELVLLQGASRAYPRRESWVQLAHAWLLRNNAESARECALYALNIDDGRYAHHSDPGAWSFKPHEIAMLACYELDQLEEAIAHGQAAELEASGEDLKRISDNLLAFRAKLVEMRES